MRVSCVHLYGESLLGWSPMLVCGASMSKHTDPASQALIDLLPSGSTHTNQALTAPHVWRAEAGVAPPAKHLGSCLLCSGLAGLGTSWLFPEDQV